MMIAFLAPRNGRPDATRQEIFILRHPPLTALKFAGSAAVLTAPVASHWLGWVLTILAVWISLDALIGTRIYLSAQSLLLVVGLRRRPTRVRYPAIRLVHMPASSRNFALVVETENGIAIDLGSWPTWQAGRLESQVRAAANAIERRANARQDLNAPFPYKGVTAPMSPSLRWLGYFSNFLLFAVGVAVVAKEWSGRQTTVALGLLCIAVALFGFYRFRTYP